MTSIRLTPLLLALVLFPIAALAQSADQEVVSIADSPDPVVPGNTLTYTIVLNNNGPDPAVNGGINVNLPFQTTYQTTVVPAGFSCSAFGPNVSCTTPSFAVGSVVFTMTVLVDPNLLNFPDGSLSAAAFPSGTTPDPNNTNNLKTATTVYDSPQIDLSVAATDSPDPVAPDGNITYTVDVANAGPDSASSVSFNVFNSGSLQFQSATVPAGWACTLPPVNGTPTFICTHPSLAAAASSTFTVVARASAAVVGLSDTTVSTTFSVDGTGNDTNGANDSVTVSTAYVAPDADLAVTSVDTPDPVVAGGTISYAQSVTNNGPDAASLVTFAQSTPVGTTFGSMSAPAGWTCSTPAVGGTGVISCSKASMANGESGSFTLVVTVTAAGTISSSASVLAGATSDPNPGNNTADVTTTATAAPQATLSIAKTAPVTEVAVGSSFAYSIVVANGGPDGATNVVMTDPLPASLLFTSLVAPAGWSCTTPPAGSGGTVTCAIPSLANGASATFMLTVTVAAGATGTIVNSASVTAPEETGAASASAPAVNVASGEPIPTLSVWMLIALAAIVSGAALLRLPAS
jgi:uncharacterized repeat protein (TIGR01451 family)